jgi:hypothetical protein
MRLEEMTNEQKFLAVDIVDNIYAATYEDYQRDFRQGDTSEQAEEDQAYDIFTGWGADLSKVTEGMRPGEFAISLVPVAREMLRAKVNIAETLDLITPNANEYQVISQMLDGTLPLNLNALSPDAKAHAESFIDRVLTVYNDEQYLDKLSYLAWGSVHAQIYDIIADMPAMEVQKDKGINKALLYGGAAAIIALLVS